MARSLTICRVKAKANHSLSQRLTIGPNSHLHCFIPYTLGTCFISRGVSQHHLSEHSAKAIFVETDRYVGALLRRLEITFRNSDNGQPPMTFSEILVEHHNSFEIRPRILKVSRQKMHPSCSDPGA